MKTGTTARAAVRTADILLAKQENKQTAREAPPSRAHASGPRPAGTDSAALPATTGTTVVAAQTFGLPGFLKLGFVLLLLAGFAFGVLEVHSSNDTWIALTAGRQIIEDYGFPRGFPRNFPTVDKFSYTFYDKPFFNQNWLSHVYFWLLYDHLGPNWVVYGTWAAAWWMFIGVLLSVRLRCGSWWAGVFAAGVVATASRDWLSARPATIQFACMSTLWLCFAALLGQRGRERWWPIGLMFVLFTLWTHAHGSFVFGFLMTGLFIGCTLLVRGLTLAGVWRHATAITDRQLIAVIVVALVTGVLGAVLSPYGLENYTHPLKVAESPLFREIGEWTSPFLRPFQQGGAFPPVKRFWVAFGLAVVCSLVVPVLMSPIFDDRALRSPVARRDLGRFIRSFVATVWIAAMLYVMSFALPKAAWVIVSTILCLPALLFLWSGEKAESQPRAKTAPLAGDPAGATWLHTTLFDVISVAIGVYMVFFARRFAPIFYIAAAPVLATWIVRLAQHLEPQLRRWAADSVVIMSWVAAVFVGYQTVRLANAELVEPFPPGERFNLLDRVTRMDQVVRTSIEFLARNHLKPNVFTEWTQAGSVMFLAPGARVYIDGRSQQVYSEGHYRSYLEMMYAGERERAAILDRLTSCGTEVVLLRRTRSMISVLNAVATSPDWKHVMGAPLELMFARVGSDFYAEVLRRERAGDLWWPEQADAQLARGSVLARMDPPELERALACWQTAVALDANLGMQAYHWITAALTRLGRMAEAEAFLRSELSRVHAAKGLGDNERGLLLRELQKCQQGLQRVTPAPGTP